MYVHSKHSNESASNRIYRQSIGSGQGSVVVGLTGSCAGERSTFNDPRLRLHIFGRGDCTVPTTRLGRTWNPLDCTLHAT